MTTTINDFKKKIPDIHTMREFMKKSGKYFPNDTAFSYNLGLEMVRMRVKSINLEDSACTYLPVCKAINASKRLGLLELIAKNEKMKAYLPKTKSCSFPRDYLWMIICKEDKELAAQLREAVFQAQKADLIATNNVGIEIGKDFQSALVNNAEPLPMLAKKRQRIVLKDRKQLEAKSVFKKNLPPSQQPSNINTTMKPMNPTNQKTDKA